MHAVPITPSRTNSALSVLLLLLLRLPRRALLLGVRFRTCSSTLVVRHRQRWQLQLVEGWNTLCHRQCQSVGTGCITRKCIAGLVSMLDATMWHCCTTLRCLGCIPESTSRPAGEYAGIAPLMCLHRRHRFRTIHNLSKFTDNGNKKYNTQMPC